MNYKKGDKVKFLNDVGSGTITEIIDNLTVKVLNDTGFEIPVLIEELMPDYSKDEYQVTDFDIEEDKNDNFNQYDEEPVYTDNTEVNVYIAFVPENPDKPEDSDMSIFLINDSNYFLQYNFVVKGENNFKSINRILEPNIKENIYRFETLMLSDNFEAVIQILFFDKKEFDILKPVHKELKIKNVKFMRKGIYIVNDFFEKNAMIIPVYESNSMQEVLDDINNTNFTEVINQKEKKNRELNKPKTFKKKEPKNIKEIDLHIHELLDDDSGMTDFDKLQYQLEVFHKEMKSAIKEGYKRIVFIHGVGSGSLKLKIRSELQHKYKQYQFQDASFREYGYGATMVMLKK